jgi:hypothetical protein
LIEANKRSKYAKIIMYNHSIPNDEHLRKLFDDNKELVVLEPYHYLPYIDPKTKKIINLNYEKTAFEHGTLGLYIKRAHEAVVIYECYISNFYI